MATLGPPRCSTISSFSAQDEGPGGPRRRKSRERAPHDERRGRASCEMEFAPLAPTPPPNLHSRPPLIVSSE